MADSFVNEDSRKDSPTSVVLSGEVGLYVVVLKVDWTEEGAKTWVGEQESNKVYEVWLKTKAWFHVKHFI